jgi:hypothetical protein
MKLIFSTQFDNPVYQTSFEIGTQYVGPLILLPLLERELGIFDIYSNEEQRQINYKKCLQQCASKDSFYKESFHNDELNVAKKLLAYRDELVMLDLRISQL